MQKVLLSSQYIYSELSGYLPIDKDRYYCFSSSLVCAMVSDKKILIYNLVINDTNKQRQTKIYVLLNKSSAKIVYRSISL